MAGILVKWLFLIGVIQNTNFDLEKKFITENKAMVLNISFLFSFFSFFLFLINSLEARNARSIGDILNTALPSYVIGYTLMESNVGYIKGGGGGATKKFL
jgi:hypothetical protein